MKTVLLFIVVTLIDVLVATDIAKTVRFFRERRKFHE